MSFNIEPLKHLLWTGIAWNRHLSKRGTMFARWHQLGLRPGYVVPAQFHLNSSFCYSIMIDSYNKGLGSGL